MRLLQRIILGVYLLVTAGAVIYTLTRITVLPWPLIHWSYGMMAPYQDYTKENGDLVAEAQTASGSWIVIDLAPYYPYDTLGEANLRTYLLPFQWGDEEGRMERLEEQYHRLAQRLYAHLIPENIQAVRLTWDAWPISPGGFEAMRKWPFVQSTLITQYP